MQVRKATIDVIGNSFINKDLVFVMTDNISGSESLISEKAAHEYYINGDYKCELEFTRKALDEIQNAIEDELVRQEKSHEAFHAAADAKVCRQEKEKV